MSARTPGPWRWSHDAGDGRVTIGNDAVEIASVNTENCDDIETAKDDARFIVTACNAYDDLLSQRDALAEALREIERLAAPHAKGIILVGRICEAARAALVKREK